MDWKNKVVDALIKGDCFFSTFQKMRFIQLFNELKDEPFFSKGFCKCVFLASCDQEHTDFFKKVVDKLISMDAKNTDYMLKLSDEHASSLKANEKVLFSCQMIFCAIGTALRTNPFYWSCPAAGYPSATVRFRPVSSLTVYKLCFS